MNWLRGTDQQGAARSRESRARNLAEAQARKQKEIEKWRGRLDGAETYVEWHNAAERLDELEGHNEWKRNPASPYYDWNLLRERLKNLNELVANDNTVMPVATGYPYLYPNASAPPVAAPPSS
jgi:hypothetical protein